MAVFHIVFIYLIHFCEFVFRETKAILKGKHPLRGVLMRYTLEFDRRLGDFKKDAVAKLKKAEKWGENNL